MKMKNLTKCLFITIIIGFVSCNTDRQQVSLKKGNYILKKFDNKVSNKNKVTSSVSFVSGTLHINNDSLTFPGFKNIGTALFGQDKFKYQISGNEIVLYNDNFKKTFDFEITKDSLIKLEVNKGKIKNIYFKHQTLSVVGKYQIKSYTKRASISWEDIKKYHGSVLGFIAFEFFKDNTVTINPKLSQYLVNKPTFFNAVFQYEIKGNKIIFSNSKETFELQYSYDGILRLHLSNEVFKKFDLGKIE